MTRAFKLPAGWQKDGDGYLGPLGVRVARVVPSGYKGAPWLITLDGRELGRRHWFREALRDAAGLAAREAANG